MVRTRTLLPSVDDWYSLTRRYPEYATLSGSPLKDFGYMAVMSEVFERETARKLRVLEFGHMFNASLFVKLESQAETWGIDDIGIEHYIPQGAEWEGAYKKHLLDRCPATRFVRGYLGRDMDKLPPNYFDVVCSVSVYDNIPSSYWSAVTRHAFDVLQPGGAFINTYDFPLRYTHESVRKFIEVQRNSGFTVADPGDQGDADLLIESQFAVINWYQKTEPPETRKYMGNFGTVLTIASKR